MKQMFIVFLFLFSLQANASPLFIDDVASLIEIEKHGYSFGKDHPAYGILFETIKKDLEKAASEDQKIGTTMRYSRRLFNSAWLTSEKSFFELAGIVFRPERKFRHQNSCGEIRLIYRLAYRDAKTTTYSRLPMTVQHIHIVNTPCEKVFSEWQNNSKTVLDVLSQSKLFDIELNLQSVRWPAAIKPDMGTYAEYLMRAFVYTSGTWRTRKLDNAIDVEKMKRDKGLKKDLLSWLKQKENVESTEQGETLLPEKFLTDKVVSIAVHGLNRRANLLFSQIFTEGELASIDYSKKHFIKSPQGYLRKLDELTCSGCHQSKSIAGFHFVGRDREGSIPFNMVKVPFSVHFFSDQLRRLDFMKKIARKEKSLRSFLGFADRSMNSTGAKNDRCYEGKDISFSAWTCKGHLKCEPTGAAIGKEFFGICQEKKIALVGDACYFGRIRQNTIANREQEVNHVAKNCAVDLGCLRPSNGYPGGLCFANFCKNTLTKSCAMLAVPGFNPCLAKGKPFKECLANFTGSIEAANCDVENPCRDDFICAEGVDGEGVCTPPYALFQLRLDGHSRP